MPEKADILARMALDSNPFRGELRKTEKVADKSAKDMARSFKAAASAAGLGALAASALEVGHEIQTLSGIAGTSSEQFQRNAFAAKSVGIEQQKLSDIYKDMRDRVGDFLREGGGPMQSFFENIAPKIGVTAEQFRHLSGPDALQLYYTSLQKANISHNEVVTYMEEISGDVTALIPLLKDGGAEFERMGQKAKVMGDETVKALSDARTNLAQAKSNITVVSGSVLGFANGVVEDMTKVALSVASGRNVFAEMALAEADAAYHAEIMADQQDRARKKAEEAAAVQADYNQRLKEYEEWQMQAAAAAKAREEAERKLRIEFDKAVSEYAAEEELTALKLRASGEIEAADAMDKRVQKIKDAIAYSKRYNITLEQAANLVENLARQEELAAAKASATSDSSTTGAGSSAESPDDKIRGKIRTGQIKTGQIGGFQSRFGEGPSMRERERAAGLYNATLGRSSDLATPTLAGAATPSAKEKAAASGEASAPASEATLKEINNFMRDLKNSLSEA